jgi:hypothetical protein
MTVEVLGLILWRLKDAGDQLHPDPRRLWSWSVTSTPNALRVSRLSYRIGALSLVETDGRLGCADLGCLKKRHASEAERIKGKDKQ